MALILRSAKGTYKCHILNGVAQAQLMGYGSGHWEPRDFVGTGREMIYVFDCSFTFTKEPLAVQIFKGDYLVQA